MGSSNSNTYDRSEPSPGSRGNCDETHRAVSRFQIPARPRAAPRAVKIQSSSFQFPERASPPCVVAAAIKIRRSRFQIPDSRAACAASGSRVKFQNLSFRRSSPSTLRNSRVSKKMARGVSKTWAPSSRKQNAMEAQASGVRVMNKTQKRRMVNATTNILRYGSFQMES